MNYLEEIKKIFQEIYSDKKIFHIFIIIIVIILIITVILISYTSAIVYIEKKARKDCYTKLTEEAKQNYGLMNINQSNYFLNTCIKINGLPFFNKLSD